MRNKLLVLTLLTPVLLCSQARAADFSSIKQVPVMLNLLILVGAVACLAIAVRLLGLVKGGALARGIQMWLISFVTLAVAQVIILADKFGFFTVTFDLAAVLYVGTVILWFSGLLHARKVLG